MRVLICPTAFKETLSAKDVAEAIAGGVRASAPGAELRLLPLSDGGPGLLEAIAAATPQSDPERVLTTGPMGGPVVARTLRTGARSIVIETAEACGLHLVPLRERDPLGADSGGIGILLSHYTGAGVNEIVLGLGGSATVDGGTGMARALGWRFLDDGGRDLPPGGGALGRLARVVPSESRPDGEARIRVTALADVRSPLLGPDGSAHRFAAQKGATDAQIARLEFGLARLADVAARDLGVDVRDVPGTGAAGGLGAGCLLFLDADLRPGAEWVLDAVGFDQELAAADLVITGEGAWDATSDLGKITRVVLDRARDAGVPALVISGRFDGPAPPGVRTLAGSGDLLGPDEIGELVEREFRSRPIR
jgi:glycerate kinase